MFVLSSSQSDSPFSLQNHYSSDFSSEGIFLSSLPTNCPITSVTRNFDSLEGCSNENGGIYDVNQQQLTIRTDSNYNGFKEVICFKAQTAAVTGEAFFKIELTVCGYEYLVNQVPSTLSLDYVVNKGVA